MTPTTAGHPTATGTARPSTDRPDPPPTRRPKRRLGATIRVTILAVILLAISLVWIYPFIWMVSASLKSPAEIFEGLNLVPDVLRLDNYVRAWTAARIGQAFWNTVFVAVTSTVLSVASSATIGYVLGRYAFPGKKIIIGAFAAAIFLPEGYTIIPTFDILNRLDLTESLWGLVLAQVGGAHVVAILLFMGYFRQLPHELEEAARVDGAGFVRIFTRIYLPLAKPVIATAAILQFMHSWNDFLLPLVMTLSRPELQTLSVGVYSFAGEEFNDWGGMTAASTIALIPIIIVFLFLQRYFVESIAGAMKG